MRGGHRGERASRARGGGSGCLGHRGEWAPQARSGRSRHHEHGREWAPWAWGGSGCLGLGGGGSRCLRLGAGTGRLRLSGGASASGLRGSGRLGLRVSRHLGLSSEQRIRATHPEPHQRRLPGSEPTDAAASGSTPTRLMLHRPHSRPGPWTRAAGPHPLQTSSH